MGAIFLHIFTGQVNFSRLQRGGHLDNPLVGGAPEAQAQVLFRQDKGAVYQYVYPLQPVSDTLLTLPTLLLV